MYVVTGGLGFIGSHIVRALADRGEKVMIVEDLAMCSNKIKNISDCAHAIVDIFDISEFSMNMRNIMKLNKVAGIFHEGACVNTKETDFKHMISYNTEFTQALIEVAAALSIKIVYASSAAVYGMSRDSREHSGNECPLNVYALSKLIVDNAVRALPKNQPFNNTIVGLRYFNVYGKNEDHKESMASMIHQMISKAKLSLDIELFDSCSLAFARYSRDFVHVDDVVNVNMHFMFNDKIYRDVFNVGTGETCMFESAAMMISKALGSRSKIVNIPMPESIREFYQSFTKADLENLRNVGGYTNKFLSLNDGLQRMF